MNLVVTNRPWGRQVFDEQIRHLPGTWQLADQIPDEGSEHWNPPERIFFLFWSERVTTWLLERVESIGFHLSNLVDSRGGSPLQNLIARGYRETVVTAFRMTEEMDAGPVYVQSPLSLEGLAEEVYLRAAEICAQQIRLIASGALEAKPLRDRPEQVSFWKRRRPEQSEIPPVERLEQLWDHLRMLDADGYPRAFLLHGGYRYTFSRPALRTGRIEAAVVVTKEVS